MRRSTIEYIGAKPRRKKKKHILPKFLLLLLCVAGGVVGVMRYGTTPVLASPMKFAKKVGVEDYITQKLTEDTRQNKLVAAALRRTEHSITYDPAYYSIGYPMGDIPEGRGVCTDVVIRAYRTMGIDLQELVHLDMGQSFASYPKTWGLKKRDTNIDHRRVPNLQNFFTRNGKSLTISNDVTDYQAGDLVTWKLSHGAPHIGILVPSPYADDDSLWVVHNIGSGPQWDNCLFNYKITGHYRYELD